MASGRRLYNLAPLVPYIEREYTLLTPNYRLARRIKSQWDEDQREAGAGAWRALPVYPLEAWLIAQWRAAVGRGALQPRVLLDDARVKLLWRQVIEEDADAALSMLQPAAAAEQAAGARDALQRWRLDAADPALAREFSFDADCASFLRWQGRFEQRLAQSGLTTAIDCQRELLQVSPPGPGASLLLLDFDEIAPLPQACLAHLGGELVELDSGCEAARHSARAYPDKGAELVAIARWAARCSRQQPGATVGIVLADMEGDRQRLEYLLRREFGCLGEDYASLPVNFSTGISLDRAPVVRDALRMLAACTGVLPLADVAPLLQSRFSGLADSSSSKAIKLLTRLYEDGLPRVDTGRLRYLANEVRLHEKDQPGLPLGQLLSDLASMRLQGLRLAPSQWLELIAEILDRWGWPGPGPLDSLEYQQVERWYETLEYYAGFDQLGPPVAFDAMLQGLHYCCQNRVSQPQTADSAVQVLGPLEAAGLHFDFLWLSGLQASRWPPAPRPNPFLPQRLQVEHGLPHASSEREWQFVDRLMTQFLRSAGEVIASYCRELEGIPELPSALLADWPLESPVAGDGEHLPQEWLEQRRGLSTEILPESDAPAVSPAEQLAPVGGSAVLEDQANCPFRAFARRRLLVEPLGDTRVGLTAADRGSLLHDALYALWGVLGDSAALCHLEEADLERLTGESVRVAMDRLGPGLRPLAGSACLELEARRLTALLRAWLEQERARPPFRVIAREEPLEVVVGGLELRLRVDRVDQLGDGRRLLIDYKSGRNSLADWLGPRPRAPQLPLYAIAEEDVSGVAFAEIRPREQRLLGLAEVEGIDGVRSDIAKAVGRYGDAESWQELLSGWRESLEALARDFQAGRAGVDPLPRACDYCGLEALCRVRVQVDPAELSQ